MPIPAVPQPNEIQKPYVLFVADQCDPLFAKTAIGLRDWCPQDCVAQMRLQSDAVDLNLPDVDAAGAAASGARTAVIGVAAPGGALPSAWIEPLSALMEAGLDIASGLHDALGDNPILAERAAALGRQLHNVRLPGSALSVGTGRKRSGKRMLTVGTDCAVGKKYTALSVARALRRNGIPSTFRATGQTGILIAGGGTAVDAVKADFISGAAEALSPDNSPDHWDIIEGQGSLFHPSYAAVTTGLVHGSQPDLMILCHQSGRTKIAGVDGFDLPSLSAAVDRYTEVARLTNPMARVVSISLNCSAYPEQDVAGHLDEVRAKTGLPVFDPLVSAFEEDLLRDMNLS